jgi:hypothetical protein
MKNISIILLGFGIMIAANLAGHFFPPFSLMNSFIYINIVIGLVNLRLYKFNFKITIIYNFILLVINDLLIRLYAGGTHDSQGMALCWVMFHLGFIIATIIMIAYSLTFNKENKFGKFSNFNIVVIGTILTAVFYNYVNAKI